MKGASKEAIGAAVVVLVSLSLVLGLVLVLLVELYCSLLLRKRRLRTASTTAATTTNNTNIASASPSQSSQSLNRSAVPFGVLDVPRSFLFPSVSTKDDNTEFKYHPNSHALQILESQIQESSATPRFIGVVSVPSPYPTQEHPAPDKAGENLMCISNPIYDDRNGSSQGEKTPFETPSSSPSRLEMGGSLGEGGDPLSPTSPPLLLWLPNTPPLTPMKKLPAEARSVSPRAERPLKNSGSDSNTKNGASSSSSVTPCTSPSWYKLL